MTARVPFGRRAVFACGCSFLRVMLALPGGKCRLVAGCGEEMQVHSPIRLACGSLRVTASESFVAPKGAQRIRMLR